MLFLSKWPGEELTKFPNQLPPPISNSHSCCRNGPHDCACLSSGLLLGKMGERGAPLVNVCQCINECVMKIINAAMW